MNTMHARLDKQLAMPMFVASMLYLLLLAGILHLNDEAEFGRTLAVCRWGLLLLHPLFILEFVAHCFIDRHRWKSGIWYCVFPPLRVGARDFATGECLFLPRWSWVKVDEHLQARVARAFSIPMIIIALMVLPLMAIEHFWQEQITSNLRLAYFINASTGLIWLAFTFEFTLMISIVENKAGYCKKHWIDIAVICLPLIAFLRAARLGRLGRILRLNNLSKTVRIYRLRGLLMKLYRAALVLEVIERLLRPDPQKRLEQLRMALVEKESEIDRIRAEISQIEGVLTQEKAAA